MENKVDKENISDDDIGIEATLLPEIMDEEVSIEPSLEEQLETMKDQWLRAVAETENIRNRALREKEESLKYGSVSLARDVISSIDNLRRAMDACSQEDKNTLSPSLQGLITGVEMIVQEFDVILKKHSIQRLHPLNELFNAHLHQAMFEITNNEHPSGTVLQVMQDGYVMHDRLLRPALVGVSKVEAV